MEHVYEICGFTLTRFEIGWLIIGFVILCIVGFLVAIRHILIETKEFQSSDAKNNDSLDPCGNTLKVKKMNSSVKVTIFNLYGKLLKELIVPDDDEAAQRLFTKDEYKSFVNAKVYGLAPTLVIDNEPVDQFKREMWFEVRNSNNVIEEQMRIVNLVDESNYITAWTELIRRRPGHHHYTEEYLNNEIRHYNRFKAGLE